MINGKRMDREEKIELIDFSHVDFKKQSSYPWSISAKLRKQAGKMIRKEGVMEVDNSLPFDETKPISNYNLNQNYYKVTKKKELPGGGSAVKEGASAL